MSDDKQQYITEVGLAAEAASIASGVPLKITKIVFGDGVKPADTNPRNMTALVNPVKEYSCDVYADNNTLFASVAIPGTDGGYTINEVGLLLSDGALYSYGEGNGDQVTVSAEGLSESIIIRIAIKTTNSGGAVIEVSSNPVYVTFEDFDKHDHSGLLVREDLGDADLNTKREYGIYYQYADSKSLEENNYPVQKYGTLTVTESHQTYYASNNIYIRSIYRNGKFGGWSTIYSTYNQPTKSDVGLNHVNNYDMTSSLSINSDAWYSTARAAYTLNNKITDLADNLPTKLSLGLDKVENLPKSNDPSQSSSQYYASSNALNKVYSDLESFKQHGHTPASVGLGNVKNYNITDALNSTSSQVYASAKSVGSVNSALDTFKTSLNKVSNYAISDSYENNSSTSYASSKAAYSLYQRTRTLDQNISAVFDEAVSKLGATETAVNSLKLNGVLASGYVRPNVKYTGRLIVTDYFETTGNTGLYNSTHGGYMYMQDSSYWRLNKGIVVAGNSYFSLNLTVTGALTLKNHLWMTEGDAAQNLYVTGSVTAKYSDVRLKTNIQPVTGALSDVMSWEAIRYTPNQTASNLGGYDTNEKEIGLKAHQIQKTTPEAVSLAPFDTDENGNSKSGENYLTVDYARLVPQLVASIQELTKKVQILEGK